MAEESGTRLEWTGGEWQLDSQGGHRGKLGRVEGSEGRRSSQLRYSLQAQENRELGASHHSQLYSQTRKQSQRRNQEGR